MIGLIAAGVVGVWLFLAVWQTDSATSDATRARIERDTAEFDRDFSRAWNGNSNPALEDRAKVASEKLDRVDRRREAVQADQLSKAGAMQGEVEKEMSAQGVNLDSLKSQVTKAANQ